MKFFNILAGIALVMTTGYLIYTEGHREAAPTVPTVQQAKQLGAFTPVGGTTYYLSGAGITASATTIQVTSFQTPDGRNLTMTMFGATGYAALEPGTSKLEDVTFTGITQNSNGTATLTGVSRGVDFISPYAASTTLAKAHSGGSTFILTNTAGFYGQQFLFANNISTSTAVITFSSSSPPVYDSNPTFGSNSLALVNKAYADSLAFNGAATSSEANLGLVQLANQAQVGSSTASTTFGGPLVISNKFATTTPGTQCTSGKWSCIVATVAGKISQSFLDLTASFAFTGSITETASSTFGTGTTTLTGPVSFAGTAGTVVGLDWQLIVATTSAVTQSNVQATTTTSYTRYKILINGGGLSGADSYTLRFNNDQAANYTDQSFADAGAAVGGTNAGIRLNSVATTSPSFFEVDIVASTTLRKFVTWTGGLYSGTLAIPSSLRGAGLWNNTSSAVTNFELVGNGANSLLTGTKMTIYGSNN